MTTSTKEKYAEYRYIWKVQQHSDVKIADRIVRDMGIMLHRPKVLSKALGALWNLSSVEKNKDYLTTIGAAQAVIAVMYAHKRDITLLRLSCGVIKNLGGNLLAIEKMGAGDLVMHSIRNFGNNKELAEQACSAIRNLGQCKQNAENLVKREVTRLILDCMDQHKSNPDTLKQACSALWSLSTAQHCKEKLWSDGAGQAVVLAMKNFPNELRLQENALGLIWTIGHHYSMMKIGGGEVVLKALQRHSKSKEIVLYCCFILKNLGSIRSNAIELVEANAAEILMTAMTGLKHEVAVQDNGCSAFWALALWNETKLTLVKRGLATFALEVMKESKGNAKVFCSSASVITNLAANEETVRLMDRISAGRSVLIGISKFKKSETAFEKGIFCLRNLFFWDIPGLKEINAEPVIKEALQKYPKNNTIRKKGGELLSKLKD